MQWRDQEIEIAMGRLLLIGVIAAGSVVAAGGVLFMIRHGGEMTDYATFHGVPAELKSPAGVLRGAFALHARSIIQLGVLLMIATPVLRVTFAVVSFTMEKDRMYTLISGIVLGLLGYALLGAH